jgi:predicted outer membrane repeat protein
LTDAFNFGGKKITIGGTGIISPSVADIRFSGAGTEVSPISTELNFAMGNSIVFDGFSKSSTIILNTSAEYSEGSGGVIAGWGNVTLSGNGNFTNNSVDYYGGAIESFGEVVISGSNTFVNNTAVECGGAIDSCNNVTISGTSTFSNNTAQFGGAVYGENVTVSGNSTFTNNTAQQGSGGAIYSDTGNVSITASSGNIVFAGNKANNTPNAIYMNNNNGSGSSTLSLAATDGNSVQFYDPISNNGTLGSITINGTADQTGTVLFDMSSNSGTR